MTWRHAVAILLLPVSVAAAGQVPPRSIPEPPRSAIVRYVAGPARCGAAEPRVILAEEPFPRAFRTERDAQETWETVLRFSIDAAGRPHAIAVAAPGRAGADERDLPAALSAWRFAPGQESRDCDIRFAARAVPVARAELDSLQRYLVYRRVAAPESFTVRAQADARLRPSGTTCADGGLSGERTVAYPDWDKVAPAAGTFPHSALLGDVNAAGQPENVRVVSSSGNAELDRESIAAVLRSRYPAVARRNCSFYYVVWSETPMPAPRPPRLGRLTPRDARCPRPAVRWAEPPRPAVPEAFKARRIQGWAVLRYDISPEGRPSRAEVVAAEPASAFGDAALAALPAALAAPTAAGSRGCVERFDFR